MATQTARDTAALTAGDPAAPAGRETAARAGAVPPPPRPPRSGSRARDRGLAARVRVRPLTAEEGQATAEYGLVVVAAAGIAAALIAFGQSGFEVFFERVVETIVDSV